MRMVPKSGWPVIGQTQVNSGHSIAISYGRSGFGLGKVSRLFDGWLGMRVLLTPLRRDPIGAAPARVWAVACRGRPVSTQVSVTVGFAARCLKKHQGTPDRSEQ